MTPNDILPPTLAAVTTDIDIDEHLGVLAEALRDDDEHYEDPPVGDAG
ncbi:MAG: hypothetical protein AB7O44_31770 [Hyphomicrobiaceae bacterium]